jgi:predicted helicase
MRRSLMNAFTEIYILNLHGNSKKKERAPDGSPDENVFDIQQGVTLGIFVKEPDKVGPAKVFHADLWGLRETKYQRLFETDVNTTIWTQLGPQPPAYLFIEQDKDLSSEYENGWKITDAMPVNSLGIATARDNFAIRWSGAEVIRVARDFAALPIEEARTKYDLGEDVRDWKVTLAQEDLREHGIRSLGVKEILYRPFDHRFTYYTGRTRGFHCRPRREVMNHLLAGKNLGLSTTRSIEIGRGWEHVFCSQHITQLHTVSLKEVNYLFPLYLFDGGSPETGQRNLSESVPTFSERRANLKPGLIEDIRKRTGLQFTSDAKGDLKKTFGPEDVFDYIYAVLHSPTYRTRYTEFLKSDFPRVPLTSDVKQFRVLSGLGAELVGLHLLESPKLGKPIARYPVTGPNIVEKGFPKYLAPGEPEPGKGTPLPAGRVYISKPETQSGAKGQYFEGVPSEVWNFHIGGYQVCEQWLKDRRGRTLTYDDLEHYCKVVTALNETIRLMADIDTAIPKWPIE